MKSILNPNFSHLYIEQGAEDYPDAKRIIKKFQQAKIIKVSDYKHVFNRRGQSFQVQKQSVKLILAIKKDKFIYDGSRFAPSFGHPHFYYNALILNCIYNCDYCYLQGMYSSGNIVMFVNAAPYFQAAEDVIKAKGSVYLCLSYDTDLLAFENLIPNCRRWIEWAASRPTALLEIRTKSTNFSAIADLKVNPNVILAWTVSPEQIVKKYETKTPSLAARLTAINEALKAGWSVRICIDPILNVKHWKELYSQLIKEITDQLDIDRVNDFSLGVFRMNHEHLDAIKKMRQDSDILYFPFEHHDRSVSYSHDLQSRMTHFVKELITDYSPESTVNIFA